MSDRNNRQNLTKKHEIANLAKYMPEYYSSQLFPTHKTDSLTKVYNCFPQLKHPKYLNSSFEHALTAVLTVNQKSIRALDQSGRVLCCSVYKKYISLILFKPYNRVDYNYQV
jgi:hypothetical protein